MDSQIQKIELGRGPSKKLWDELTCGYFHLIATLKDQKKNIMSFSSIEVKKLCLSTNSSTTSSPSTTAVEENFVEKPALSIEVEIETDSINQNLERGNMVSGIKIFAI